ncbi:hydroxylase [Leptolyngbya valderiana BDU 20041]|nr:hydroxylase [Leptolyngbya valderiana BDU 20041]
MGVRYLEIVTPDVDATCDLIGRVQGIEFGQPVAELGGARLAALAGGGELAVRGPLRPDENPVVRPYLMVDDLDAAVAAARNAGATIAIDRMAIPGHGVIAIYILGGIEHGLWMLEGDDEEDNAGG